MLTVLRIEPLALKSYKGKHCKKAMIFFSSFLSQGLDFYMLGLPACVLFVHPAKRGEQTLKLLFHYSHSLTRAPFFNALSKEQPQNLGQKTWELIWKYNVHTLVTRIDNPWLLLATLPLYHPVQDLKMTPLLQFTPVNFLKSTPLPLLTPVCNFKALLGASLISMNQ